jgi:hypothetical protein
LIFIFTVFATEHVHARKVLQIVQFVVIMADITPTTLEKGFNRGRSAFEKGDDQGN